MRKIKNIYPSMYTTYAFVSTGFIQVPVFVRVGKHIEVLWHVFQIRTVISLIKFPLENTRMI